VESKHLAGEIEEDHGKQWNSQWIEFRKNTAPKVFKQCNYTELLCNNMDFKSEVLMSVGKVWAYISVIFRHST
jgi:hypothetical protein